MGLSPNIVKLRLELELGGKERTPPTEFRIFPFGDVRTSKGTFRFDEDDAAAVLEGFLSQGNELPIDYDPLSVDPVLPGQGKAAVWFVPEVRRDGLWAANVRWTPDAAKMLSAAEYRFFSPAFAADKTGSIRSLLNVAITNLPATKDMRPLVAASKENPMHKKMSEKLKKLSEAKHDELSEKCGLSKTRLRELADGKDATEEEMKKLSEHLDLDGDEPEPKKASLIRLTGAASEEEAEGTILAWKRGHEQVTILSNRIEQLERETRERDLDGVVAAALTDGKLAPSQADWAREYGRQSLPGLKKFLSVAMPIGAETATMPPPGSELAVLSSEELAMCKLLGEDPKELAQHKLSMHKAGRA